MRAIERVGVELRAALGLLTAWSAGATGAPRDVLAGSLMTFPVVGLALGVVAAATVALLPAGSGALGIVVLTALAGGLPSYGLAACASALLRGGPAEVVLARLRARPDALGWTIAALALLAEACAMTTLPRPAGLAGLAFAPLLGAWAVVVQCYGGTPVRARGRAAALVGRARFREFGGASLVALGVVLLAADAVGLALVVVAALTTVGLRVYCHRRLGGLTGKTLLATRALVEAVVLVVLALLAR